jgi:uncharacterized protein with GYD domain
VARLLILARSIAPRRLGVSVGRRALVSRSRRATSLESHRALACSGLFRLTLAWRSYFAFGDADAFVIADVPDHASASATSLAVGASGGAHCKTIVLMTPEEVDQASKKPLTYTGPGR